MRRDDEDDHSGGASWVDRIVIPDDISELDAEVRALRRERRVARRRDRFRRLVGPGRTAGPLLLVAVLLVAGVAGLMMLFQPRRTTGGVALGTSQTSDRRLPDVLVTLRDGSQRHVRDIRPAVFALATDDCGCDTALRDTALAAQRHSVSFALVDLTTPRLPPGLTAPATLQLAEPTGALAERYGAVDSGRRVAGGPVLVLVGQNGDVVRVLPQASPRALESELSALVPQAAPAS